jgi:hypothetical protein
MASEAASRPLQSGVQRKVVSGKWNSVPEC